MTPCFHLNFNRLAHYFSPQCATNLYSYSIFKHECSGFNLVSDQCLFLYLFRKNLVVILVGKKSIIGCWIAYGLWYLKYLGQVLVLLPIGYVSWESLSVLIYKIRTVTNSQCGCPRWGSGHGGLHSEGIQQMTGCYWYYRPIYLILMAHSHQVLISEIPEASFRLA